jgi:hypothetical protein
METLQRRRSDVGGAAPEDLGGGRGDTDEDGFEAGRRCRRAATWILEGEEAPGSGNTQGRWREAGRGCGDFVDCTCEKPSGPLLGLIVMSH